MKHNHLTPALLMLTLATSPMLSLADTTPTSTASPTFMTNTTLSQPQTNAEPAPAPQSDVSTAINGLSEAVSNLSGQMVKVAHAAIHTMADMLYSYDQHLTQMMQTNSATNNLTQKTQTLANQLTLSAVQTSLRRIPDAVNNTGTDKVEAVSQINASDTLTATNSPVSILSQFFNANNTEKLEDTYFDVDSVLSPSYYSATLTQRPLSAQACAIRHGNYDKNSEFVTLPNYLTGEKPKVVGQCTYSEQQSAAVSFVDFVTRSYKPIDSDISFGKIRGNTKAMAYLQSHSKNYQAYQAETRSTIATQSIAMSNFNYLIAERTPSKDLTTANTGVPSNADENGMLSPLQVQQYVAQHDVNDPNWYKQIASASPANINRQILVVLSQIKSQMFQKHLDDERLIATMSTMGLQSNQMSQILMKIQNQPLNADIDAAIASTTDKSVQSTDNGKNASETFKDSSSDTDLDSLKAKLKKEMNKDNKDQDSSDSNSDSSDKSDLDKLQEKYKSDFSPDASGQ